MHNLVDIDPWLKPYANHIAGRRAYVDHKEKELLSGTSLPEFALGHLYFGLIHTNEGWTLREWAPNATSLVLTGDFSDWTDHDEFMFNQLDHGIWELVLPENALHHGDHYKLHITWLGGDGLRIPAYARYVVQDDTTKDFSAVVWAPAAGFTWTDDSFVSGTETPLIYEAHVGMSGEKPQVSSYSEFTNSVLPRIKHAGYNTVQLMAIQEHPYYGSFGYHVSSFFAPSSRFGTPDDFKNLVNTAHSLGLRVIVDLVHSHAVKNEAEGLGNFDGTSTQYFHAGERGVHEAWDSRVFDYGKPEVMHFLLSNCRYWLDEYHVDGYRFDGVTSMLYTHHGLEKAFTGYADYFDSNVDQDALAYLTLANHLIHDIKPSAITIAEDMSGYPGLANKEDIGFDYRLSMGVPDLWIKTLKEKKDEDWDLGTLFHELTTKRPEEKVISYAESHDQALVGDKTLIFRLIDKDMYDHMLLADTNSAVERGIALHKIIRLLTAGLHGGGYLNFMGNEFGHPEWIDFPREGNDWSYQYARRQWSLVDSDKLKYQWLGAFDKAMLDIVLHCSSPTGYVTIDNSRHTMSFERDGFIFAFNLSPTESYTDFSVPAPAGPYYVVLDTDAGQFGGQNRIDESLTYTTKKSKQGDELLLYLPARTAIVLQRAD
jgi:1,4-alpha-glucan branching enzyme